MELWQNLTRSSGRTRHRLGDKRHCRLEYRSRWFAKATLAGCTSEFELPIRWEALVSFAHIWTKSGAGRPGAVPPGRPKRDGGSRRNLPRRFFELNQAYGKKSSCCLWPRCLRGRRRFTGLPRITAGDGRLLALRKPSCPGPRTTRCHANRSFQRSGRKVLLLQVNLDYRANGSDAEEQRAVHDSYSPGHC